MYFKSFFTLFLAFATYMCEPSDNTQTGNCSGTNNTNNTNNQGLVCDEPYDLSDGNGGPGVFAGKVIQYAHINAAGLVETDTTSTLFFRVEYHVEAEPMFATVKLCRLEIPQVQVPGQPAPTSFTPLDTLYENSGPVDVPLYKEGNTTCGAISFDPAVTLFGVRLNNDFEDKIPTDPAQVCSDGGTAEHQNPCLYDMDEDGNIGVTLKAENLPGIDVKEVYVAMRSWTSTDAMVATSDLILGKAEWGLEQYPIACKLIPIGESSMRECNADEVDVVINVNPVITQVENKPGDYMAVRISPDTTCEDIVQNAADLFGR